MIYMYLPVSERHESLLLALALKVHLLHPRVLQLCTPVSLKLHSTEYTKCVFATMYFICIVFATIFMTCITCKYCGVYLQLQNFGQS